MTWFQSPFVDHADRQRLKVAVIYVALLAFNFAGWAWAITAFGRRPVLMGTAVLAYSFGLRHAFDADHIAAIDNVVRKLTQEKKKPYTVGAFFSLGHSTVVVLASLAIAMTAAHLRSRLEGLHVLGGVVGSLVSAGFLLAVGLTNLLVLRDVWAAFSRARREGRVADEDLEGALTGMGLLTRLLRRTFGLVSRSWHMYPVGLLFGLGFDTATEIGLLGISAAQATQGASMWIVLIFPMLFTAGMSLMDFTDSVLMTGAYGWAFVHPMRKLWYNLTMTATSVVAALVIGGLEALGLIADKLRLTGSAWGLVQRLNSELNLLGFCIVGFFALAWLAAFAVFHAQGYCRLAPASIRGKARFR